MMQCVLKPEAHISGKTHCWCQVWLCDVCRQEQNQIIWKFRDNLQREVSLDALRGLLEYNNQEIRSGESKVCSLSSFWGQ